MIEPPAEVRTNPPSPPTLMQLLWVKFSAGNRFPPWIGTGNNAGMQAVPGINPPAATPPFASSMVCSGEGANWVFPS